MRQVIYTFALLATLLALSPESASAQDRPVISVILPPSTDVAPLLYADHAGLFTKAGLNVQITQLPNGATIAAAIAGGSGQIGFSSLSALITGHARGLPFQLIAPGGVYICVTYGVEEQRKDYFVNSADKVRKVTNGTSKLIKSQSLHQ